MIHLHIVRVLWCSIFCLMMFVDLPLLSTIIGSDGSSFNSSLADQQVGLVFLSKFIGWCNNGHVLIKNNKWAWFSTNVIGIVKYFLWYGFLIILLMLCLYDFFSLLSIARVISCLHIVYQGCFPLQLLNELFTQKKYTTINSNNELLFGKDLFFWLVLAWAGI